MKKSKEEFFELFNKTKDLTNNFKKFEFNLLRKNPTSLIIFRNILEISQNDFSKLINISQQHICDIENENTKPSEELSKKIIIKINSIIKNEDIQITFEKIYNNYTNFINLNKLTSERAKEIRKLREIYPQITRKEEIIPNDFEKFLNTAKLARIIGELTGDGHLQYESGRNQVSFYSKNINEIEDMENRIFDLFNIKGKIHTYDKSSKKVPKATIRYGIFFNSKRLAKFLYGAGLPKGNKTKNKFQVPNWIINGSNEIKSAYLMGLFDTDGEIHQEKKTSRWGISLEQYKSENILEEGILFMQQIKELLNSLNITTSQVRHSRYNLRNDGTKSIGIKISIEEKGFENFYKYIRFNNIKKKEKLIEWTRRPAAKILIAKATDKG